MRTVRIKGREEKTFCGFISVKNHPKKNVLVVSLSDTLLPVLPQVLARVKRLFDLYCEPNVVYEALQTMNEIRPGSCIPGIRVPGCFESFEMAVRAVLGQQITVKAAGTLAGKIAKTYGSPMETGIEGLTHTFPTAEDIIALPRPIEEHLGVLGVIASRSRCILALAQKLVSGEIVLDGSADPEHEERNVPVFDAVKKWLDIYFSGREPDFMPPVHMIGSEFRQQVWKLLREIPYGETITYGGLAKRLARERGLERMSAQAVGGAVGHNEISIIVPCHRVVGSDGSLTGYAGGIDKKKRLLMLESVNMDHFYVPTRGTAL